MCMLFNAFDLSLKSTNSTVKGGQEQLLLAAGTGQVKETVLT